MKVILALTCGSCGSGDWKVSIALDEEGVYQGEVFGECLECGTDLADPIHEFDMGAIQ